MANEGNIRSSSSPSARDSSTLREFLYLFKGMRRGMKEMRSEVDGLIEEIREVESWVRECYGLDIHNLDVLEVGVGQLPRQIAYFARHNNATGIDLDVIPTDWRFWRYYEMFRSNGGKRLLKTIARKLFGMDRKFSRELRRALELDALPRPTLLTMDAEAVSFPDASFDFVYSFDVFEHLPNPGAVLKEIKRVLRPGACFVTGLHLYTSDSGYHDIRILSGERGDLPYWAHLRPRQAHRVTSAAYINQYTLQEWKQIFKSEMPGARFKHQDDKGLESKRRELIKLREVGELNEYTDEELLVFRLFALWQMPDTCVQPRS